MREEFKAYAEANRLDKQLFADAEWSEVQALVNDEKWDIETKFTVVPHTIPTHKKALVKVTNKFFK